jgi:hypothetical protein
VANERAKSRSSGGRSRGGSKKSGSNSGSSRSNDRSSSSKSKSNREFEDYAVIDPSEIPEGQPDVLIDIPVVKVDEIDLEVDDLHAQVAVLAQVKDLVQISVGVDARLGKVELRIEGVEAQALLKARLNNVGAILARVATTLDRNPELLRSVGRAVEDVGGGAGHLLDETGDAVQEVGEGAEGAVQDVGQGAGQAVGQLGQGASQAVGQVGQGAGQAVGDIGEGAGQAVGQVGEGAGRGVAGVGQGAQQATSRLAQGGGGQ